MSADWQNTQVGSADGGGNDLKSDFFSLTESERNDANQLLRCYRAESKPKTRRLKVSTSAQIVATLQGRPLATPTFT